MMKDILESFQRRRPVPRHPICPPFFFGEIVQGGSQIPYVLEISIEAVHASSVPFHNRSVTGS